MNSEVVNTSVMIYPGGRWIQRSGKGLSDFGLKQINDPHLAEIYFYPYAKELFPGADISDGISIVIKNYKKTESGFIYHYCEPGKPITTVTLDSPGDKIIPLDPRDLLISNKIDSFVENNNLSFMHDRILPRTLFGIESDFVSKNKDRVSEYNEGDIIDFTQQIKLYTNDKAGKTGRTKWFVADKSVIQNNKEYLDKWKVIVSSANAGGIKRDNQLEIIDNHSAFGRSRVALAAFDTKEEAENFYKYVSSDVIKYCFLLIDEALTTLGMKVPDMGSYSTDNSLIDYSKDVDLQLVKIMKLSTEEYEYIKNIVKTHRG